MPSVPILLAVPDPDIQARFSAQLSPLEPHCHAVIDGKTAITAAQQNSPCILIAAENLPDLSGWDLCAHFKIHPTLCRCWFILLLSAFPSEAAGKSECLPDDYIVQQHSAFELQVRVRIGQQMILAREQRDRLQLDWLRRELENLQAERKETPKSQNEDTKTLVEYAAQMQAEMYHHVEQEGKRLQSARIDTIEQAAAALRHEINNPLCAISGSAESALKRLRQLQQSGVEDLESLYRAIDRIQRGADRIDQVVQAISALLTPASTDYVPGVTMLDLKEGERGKGKGERE